MRLSEIAIASAVAAGVWGCGDTAGEPSRARPSASASLEAPAADAPRTTATASAAESASARPSSPELDEIPPEMLRRGLLVVTPRALTKPSPLLIFLHPEGMTGPRLAHDLGVETIAKTRGFAYATPDGGRVSWQASSAAWGAGSADAKQDDEIRALLVLARRKETVDPARVYVIGWESGGFMAHHLACTVRGLRGVFSVGGAGPAATDPPCTPPDPLDVIEIHGSRDDIVPYDGGVLPLKPPLPPFPSAKDTFLAWGTRLGCAGPSAGDALEIFSDLDGPETSVSAMSGCRGGAAVQLWTVRGWARALPTPAVLYAILNFIDPAGHE